MPVQNLKYCEYFDVDEKYFPCIDESAINSGAAWDTTYPHQTFVDLLTLTEKMLSGNTNRSIWILVLMVPVNLSVLIHSKSYWRCRKMKLEHIGTNLSR